MPPLSYSSPEHGSPQGLGITAGIRKTQDQVGPQKTGVNINSICNVPSITVRCY